MALTRRDMLCQTAAGCAAMAGGGLLPGCGFDIHPAPEVTATDEGSGKISVAFASATQLSQVGGTAILRLPSGSPSSAMLPDGGVLLVHHGATSTTDDFTAVAALCTHAGCPLGYSTSDAQIACPCHGSRFAATSDGTNCVGAKLRGPALSGLQAFSVTAITADAITVDLQSAPVCAGVFTPTVTNGQVILPFSDIPELATVGGSWIGQPQGLSDTLIVVRLTQTAAVANSAVCTHLACLVAYDSTAPGYACPCHGSKYDINGAVTNPPAQRALTKYTATVDATSVTVKVA